MMNTMILTKLKSKLMTQIDAQVKAKIEEIVEGINDKMLELHVLTDFVYTLGHNETDPTILKLMHLYHNHSDLILEYFIEKYRASN